jgi:hypothetical protein
MDSQSASNRVLQLQDIAHARSGDKGNHANIGVIAWTDVGFAFLDDFLTADVVAEFFQPLHPDRVERYRMPGIGAYNFLLYNVLAGGASRSLRSDSQGKTLASALLQLEVPTADDGELMLKLGE